MLDPEIPPEAEGEADGGADVVHRIARGSPAVAIASNSAVSTALPWIIAIGARSAETKGRGGEVVVPAFLRPIHPSNPNRSRPTKMPIRVSLRSWMTYFSKPRFRRRRGSSM